MNSIIIPATIWTIIKAALAITAVTTFIRSCFLWKAVYNEAPVRFGICRLMICIMLFTAITTSFICDRNTKRPDAESYSLTLPDTNVWYSSKVSPSVIENSQVTYQMIPENARNLLQETGFKLYLIDTDSDITEHNRQSGIYFHIGDYALVQTGGRYDQLLRRTLLHEVGHRLDYTNKDVDLSGTQEWKAICDQYREEGIDFFTIQEKLGQGENEAFAEAFSFSCFCPEEFSRACPEMYEYVTRAVNEMCEKYNQ